MKLQTLLTVGSVKTNWVREGCKQYSDRLDVDLIEVPAGKQKDPQKQEAEECEAILSRLEGVSGEVWALDETGKQFTSQAFSDELAGLRDRGIPVTLVLGGAYGLNDAVRARADRIIALSPMTFPHELCRIVILEQLYRANQIIKGSGYHH